MTDRTDEPFSSWVRDTYRLRGITRLPTRLYKFMSSDSKYFPLSLHELFLHSRIYLSSRMDFNDPLDSSFGVDFPEDPGAVAEFVKGIVGRSAELGLPEDYLRELTADKDGFQKTTSARLTESLDGMGIYSVSEHVTHPLMWAHYANSHRGIAVYFRCLDPKDLLPWFPIRYQPEFPRTAATPEGLEVHLMLTKGNHWQYEAEWRIAESHQARTWMAIPRNMLGGVIFGARANKETYDFVWDLIMRRADAGLPPVTVSRAVIGESFDLSFQRFVGEDQWEEYSP